MTTDRSWKDKCFVYFIKPVGMPGPIKIGCSQTPDARLENINTWSPYRLELLVSIAGSFELERKLHTCFSAFHSHGEWFHPSDEMVNGIAALKVGTAIEDAFDLSREGHSIWSTKRKNAWTPEGRLRRGYQTKVCFAVRRLTKQAPDGVWFTEPDEIENIFKRSYRSKNLTAEDVSTLDAFLQNPMKYAIRCGRAEKAGLA